MQLNFRITTDFVQYQKKNIKKYKDNTENNSFFYGKESKTTEHRDLQCLPHCCFCAKEMEKLIFDIDFMGSNLVFFSETPREF